MAQGRCSAMLAVALLVVSAAVVAQAATYDVPTWTVPTTNKDVYNTWAANVSSFLKEGDTLVFTYNAVGHNVLTLSSKADYDGCVTSAPLLTTKTGKDSLIVKAGPNYYICGVPGHCLGGQKVTVNATAASGTTPAPGTTPGTPTVPAPNSANSMSVPKIFAAVIVAMLASFLV